MNKTHHFVYGVYKQEEFKTFVLAAVLSHKLKLIEYREAEFPEGRILVNFDVEGEVMNIEEFIKFVKSHDEPYIHK